MEPVGADTEAKHRWGIVTKIGVSVLPGIVVFLVTAAFDSHINAAVILGVGTSVFVSGIAFVTQFLVEVEGEVRGVVRRVGSLDGQYAQIEKSQLAIKDEFSRINDANKLFSLVEASALNTDAMTQLIKNSTSVVVGTPSLIFDFTQAEIARLSGYLKELGRGGDVTYEGEDRDWLLGLAKCASTSIDATSLTTVDAGGKGYVDGGLWSSDLGMLYMEAQREAVKRGVQIRRIFVLDRPDISPAADFNEIVRQHIAIGVKVRVLRPSDMTPSRRASLFDFIVIDGVLSYQATIASRTIDQGRPIIITTTLVTDGRRVEERVERFKDLWNSAKDFNTGDPPPDPQPAR